MKSVYKLFILFLILQIQTTIVQAQVDAQEDSSMISTDLHDIQGEVLLDVMGDSIAVIDSLGVIRDMTNFQIGQFLSNGDIVDANADVIGSISGSVFKDMNGDIIGNINASGEIYNQENLKIGKINNKEIKRNNSNKNQLGISGNTINKRWLVAFYFFFMDSLN